MTVAVGDHLGPYRIVGRLGAGGMGEVYRARDEQLCRDVAIKVLPERTTADKDAVARFEREARAVAALSHPNILAVHSFASEGDTRYLVMELLEGETLCDRLRRAAPLETTAAVETAAQIADALAAAHERGVVHRDIKPSNVFLNGSGAVKVLDFGLARGAEADLSDDSPTDIRTHSGVALGTVGYMSPEQAAGEALDARTDVFSLGCVLHEMVTGEAPFRRATATATLAATLRDAPPPLGPAVPIGLARIISRCLEKNREARYHSARDLALDLRGLAAGEPPKPRTARVPAGVTLWAGIAAALALAAVVGFMASRGRPSGAATAISSLAVLPFENTSPREQTEYLVDGLTEGLINTLSQLPEMRVVARTTAFTYKGKPLDLGRVKRDLAVDAVLTGRLSERDGGFAVQADLVDVRTGAELWGNRYRAADTAAMEQAIATDVGRRLRRTLTQAQRARLDSRPTANAEAYRLYLQGRYEWNRRDRQQLERSRDHLQQAVDLDPTFALAQVGLADAYILMGGAFRLLPQPEALARADAAARRALEIDPGLAAAHASLGLIQANQFRWKSAERELRAALELDPNYAIARTWYATVLRVTGRRDEALAQLRQAQASDPLAPLILTNIAVILSSTGDYDGAIASARRALELDPRYAYGYWSIGRVYEAQGRFSEAGEQYRRIEGLSGPPNMARALLARIDAKLGRTAEARRVARELESVWTSGEVAPTHIAWIYSALHDNDRALYWLERGFESRDIALRDSLYMAHLAELRDDPRFAELQRRMLSVEE